MTAKKILTAEQMLHKLARSENEMTRILSNRILAGEVSVKELKKTGEFMQAVIRGDWDDALRRADMLNKFALLRDDD